MLLFIIITHIVYSSTYTYSIINIIIMVKGLEKPLNKSAPEKTLKILTNLLFLFSYLNMLKAYHHSVNWRCIDNGQQVFFNPEQPFILSYPLILWSVKGETNFSEWISRPVSEEWCDSWQFVFCVSPGVSLSPSPWSPASVPLQDLSKETTRLWRHIFKPALALRP